MISTIINADLARISYAGQTFHILRGRFSGDELRAFFGVRKSRDLWLRSTNLNIFIGPEQKHDIRDGDRFYSEWSKS